MSLGVLGNKLAGKLSGYKCTSFAIIYSADQNS